MQSEANINYQKWNKQINKHFNVLIWGSSNDAKEKQAIERV
jgi:hypothetical protein